MSHYAQANADRGCRRYEVAVGNRLVEQQHGEHDRREPARSEPPHKCDSLPASTGPQGRRYHRQSPEHHEAQHRIDERLPSQEGQQVGSRAAPKSRKASASKNVPALPLARWSRRDRAFAASPKNTPPANAPMKPLPPRTAAVMKHPTATDRHDDRLPCSRRTASRERASRRSIRSLHRSTKAAQHSEADLPQDSVSKRAGLEAPRFGGDASSTRKIGTERPSFRPLSTLSPCRIATGSRLSETTASPSAASVGASIVAISAAPTSPSAGIIPYATAVPQEHHRKSDTEEARGDAAPLSALRDLCAPRRETASARA